MVQLSMFMEEVILTIGCSSKAHGLKLAGASHCPYARQFSEFKLQLQTDF